MYTRSIYIIGTIYQLYMLTIIQVIVSHLGDTMLPTTVEQYRTTENVVEQARERERANSCDHYNQVTCVPEQYTAHGQDSLCQLINNLVHVQYIIHE